ncbi:hypothetical protein ACMFMF_000201 [Clarireedia jacksonii]
MRLKRGKSISVTAFIIIVQSCLWSVVSANGDTASGATTLNEGRSGSSGSSGCFSSSGFMRSQTWVPLWAMTSMLVIQEFQSAKLSRMRVSIVSSNLPRKARYWVSSSPENFTG